MVSPENTHTSNIKWTSISRNTHPQPYTPPPPHTHGRGWGDKGRGKLYKYIMISIKFIKMGYNKTDKEVAQEQTACVLRSRRQSRGT